jgi:hypothetical protein
LFVKACSEQHDDDVHAGKPLLAQLTAERADSWDIQYCAEAPGRALQALGRREEAAKLKALRRGF